MTYKFTVTIIPEGKWFVARCLELGVVSQGKSVEAAQRNIQEAVEIYLEDNPQTKRYLSKKAPFVTTLELRYA